MIRDESQRIEFHFWLCLSLSLGLTDFWCAGATLPTSRLVAQTTKSSAVIITQGTSLDVSYFLCRAYHLLFLPPVDTL